MHGARFRYFDFVMVAFVVVLLLSNVIGAEKRSFLDLPGIGPWPFGAGILFFPISYVIDDVLTEVYGFARARRAIWAGFAALLVHGADGMDRGPSAGRARLDRTAGLRARVRLGLADHPRLDGRLLRRRFPELGRARQDEDLDPGQASVDPHDRQHDRRRGRRQPDLLPARFLRHARLAGRRARRGDAQPVHPQGQLGSDPDARHLRRGRLAQAPRGRRRLRRRHRLHADLRSTIKPRPSPATLRTAAARPCRHAPARSPARGAASGRARCRCR